MENQSNWKSTQSSCWSRVICLSQDVCFSCLGEGGAKMTKMMLQSLAYGGGGASAQQHSALHPLPPPVLHPSSLYFQPLRHWKWSQPAERKLWLHSPDWLETESSWLLKMSHSQGVLTSLHCSVDSQFIKNHIFWINGFKCWQERISYLQMDESFSVLWLSVLLPAVEDEAVWFVPLASPVLPSVRGGLWRKGWWHIQSNKH